MELVKERKGIGGARVNGRAYFRHAEQELEIQDLDPVAVRTELEPLDLNKGPNKSRVGGNIAHNLKQLSAEDEDERRQRTERFLKQPDKHFPAEEEKRQPPRLAK